MKQFRILIFITAFGSFISCISKTESIKTADLTVSILPQKYIIDRLSDSTIEVNVIVPPGSSPEMFEPTPQVMKNISESKILFVIGPLEFERVLINRIKDLNPNLKIVNHSEGIELLEDECGHAHQEEDHSLDPHIWSSPRIYKKMVEQVYSELSSIFPDKKEIFLKNLEVLKNDINKVDSGFIVLSQLEKLKKFIVYHPAYGYLAHDYGLEQLSLEESGKNPSAEKLKNLIDTAKINGITKVFVQAQFDDHFIETLAKEINAKVVQVDPLAYNWVENNLKLIENFHQK